MTLRLPPRRAATVKQACETLLNQSNPTCTIREVARVIGLIVSCFPSVQFGELHNRYLQRKNILAFQANKGVYNEPMSFSTEARLELHWYMANNMVYDQYKYYGNQP